MPSQTKTQKVDKRKALRPDLMAKVTDPATTAHIADIACKVHNYASREEAIFGPSSSQWDSHRAPGMPSAAVMMRYLDTDWPGILNQANLFMPSSSTIQRSNSHRREAEEMIEIDKTIFTQPVFKERDRFFKPTITVIPRGEQTITAWCHRRRRIVTRVEAVYECI